MTLLYILALLSLVLGGVLVIFLGVSDIVIGTSYLAMIDRKLNLGKPEYIALLIFIVFIYLMIFFLYSIKKLKKGSGKISTRTKGGEISIKFKTINAMVKDYLIGYGFFKNVKIKTSKKGKGVEIKALIELYSIKNLNEQLKEIQDKLSKYISG